MDVSKDRGKTPKMDGYGWFIMENRKTVLKWMIWGYPYFWKHPYHGTQLRKNLQPLIQESIGLHPRKLTCPLKRDYFNRKYI